MTEEEIRQFLKGLATPENAESVGEVAKLLEAKDREIEAMKKDNVALKDRLVELAFRMPVEIRQGERGGEENAVPKEEQPLTMDEAISKWVKEKGDKN